MRKIIQKFLAASLIVAGAFASSCKPEVIDPVDPVNAVAEITVSAFDTDSGKDVSADPALKITASSSAGSSISVSGNVIKLVGSPAINQQTVTINAQFNGKTASTSVSVSALGEGGQAAYSANVVFEGTQPQNEAKAIVQVSVWDNESKSDVTAQSSFTPIGVPDTYSCKEGDDKGTFVITGIGGISAFQFTVKATFGNTVGETEVINIDNIAAGAEKTYKASISLGTSHEDEDKPAVAKIVVSAFDKKLDANVTEETEFEAMLDEGSDATLELDSNIVIITAGESLTIAAQDVTISAKYGEKCDTTIVKLSAIEKNATQTFHYDFIFNSDSQYSYSLKEMGTLPGTPVLGQLTQATHNQHIYTHSYSHSGFDITNWLYNESEFILTAEFTWKKASGVLDIVKKYADNSTDNDKAKVDEYSSTFKKTYTETPATLKAKISAFARYTAFSIRTPYTTTYNVLRTEGETSTVVGMIEIKGVYSSAQYLETAIPGHEGHYEPGHGHGHGHDDGHGGNNAGGGIIDFD